MTVPVFLHGALATHRRGRILQEALAATATSELPGSRAAVLAFADGFQGADDGEQARLVEWTRAPGHLLLLLPPFAVAPSERPVSWRAERMESAPRGGEGLATVLAPEVSYRLTGRLQAPAMPGATWSDLSVCVGAYRLHPAAGLFAVTCLPLWSLAVLDVPAELQSWLGNLVALTGETQAAPTPATASLQPDHYGFLVFLLSRPFTDEEEVVAALRSSPVFRFSTEKARALLTELRKQGLVLGVTPTADAYDLVMQSPYAPYVSALREGSSR
ncbi:hypothetical protein D9623_00375 [Azospirillum brasilense]|uniref:Uncharacterized protein n=1 Tax=Azospirillum brasilense TaxID=192 RepID=A0A0N7I7E4_AZOBR|nr:MULTISPECIES: hypothetical protein [Azospirillum]ALJ34259.1 hypothetical protein AMK58_01835 [Azospirillum brasilense]MDW7552752.1 hypothetical protein [Azospirillum brasilense]MDW7592056.1 hypothetical protein [Azospirillum brasilense]MDW7627667.1 hypothetical protein [Azospirillum brasilense]MDX5952864.1 hypothetical protein [Azospirillum brasilense]